MTLFAEWYALCRTCGRWMKWLPTCNCKHCRTFTPGSSVEKVQIPIIEMEGF